MNEDAVLLCRYVEEASEEAFTALVHQHLDLVYAAALRRTGGDAHRAADVVQEVFTALARQARVLRQHPALSGWLHAATRNVAIDLMRSEQRREQRQQAAVELETTQSATSEPSWDRLRPVLDAAIDELPGPDRLAVVLRFLERRAFAEIGAVLGVSEDAARMRTERALDKLRALLDRRGISSTAAALAVAVSSHAGAIAPTGLATAVAAKSFAAASQVGLLGSVAALVSAKMAATAIIIGLVAFVAGVSLSRSEAAAIPISPPVAARVNESDAAVRDANRRLSADVERLTAEMTQLQSAHARELAARTAAANEPRHAGVLGAPLLRHEVQRNVLNNLRLFAAARDQFRLETKRWPATMKELVGATAYVIRLVPVEGENYASLPLNGGALTLTTANGTVVTYDPDGGTTTQINLPPAAARAEELRKKVQDPAQAAREAYRLSNQGKDPKNEQALIPFFATPQEGADFVEYLEAKKKLPR